MEVGIGRWLPTYSLLLLIVLIGSASLPVTANADSQPDLTIDSIWLEDAGQPGQPVAQMLPGQSFLIVVTIKNTGQETAAGFYLDVYYDSDYGRGGPDDILAGEVQTWYVGPLTAQDGTHTTKWVVDPDNLIVELDETNNQKEQVFTVGSQTATTTVTSSTTSSTTQWTTTSMTSTTQSSSTETSSSTQSTSTSTSSTTESTSTATITGTSTSTSSATQLTSTSTPPTTTYVSTVVTQTNTGLESQIALFLGMDGADGSAVFPDSSASNHVITANGNAQVDTAQSRFGGASGIFDGAGSYLSTPDSADWAFGTGDFTIDFYVRFNALPSAGNWNGICGIYGDDGNMWFLGLYNYDDGNQLMRFYTISGGTGGYTLNVRTPSKLVVNTWYHFAFVRSGNSWYAFVNGTICESAQTYTYAIPDTSALLWVGGMKWLAVHNGWLDEFRISKGLARWTSNFTPPSVSQKPITATTTTTSGTTTFTTATSSGTTLTTTTSGTTATTATITPPATTTVVTTFTTTPTTGKRYEAKITRANLAPNPTNVPQNSLMTFTIAVLNTGSAEISRAMVKLKMYGPDGSIVSRSLVFSHLVAGTEKTVKISYRLPLSAPVGPWTYDVYLYQYNGSYQLLDQLKGQNFTVRPA